MSFLFIGLAALWSAAMVYHFIDLLRFYQLEEYNPGRFLAWGRQKWQRGFLLPELAAFPLLLLELYLIPIPADTILAAAAVMAALGLGIYLAYRANRVKIKPLVYTARARRLLGAGIFIILLQAAVCGLAFFPAIQPEDSVATGANFIIGCIVFMLLAQLTMVDILLANLLCFPIEEALRQSYVRAARQIVTEYHPTVIGITGSYGKTSTKELLGHILAARFDVYKTPKSYNTLMGVCKVIREELKPHHKYFIVEMGAYQPGEIARICQLVGPSYGILTAVGPQHLERFKTLEAVARAKNELIEALPSTGAAVFNADDPTCLRLSNQARVKVKRYGMENLDICDAFARNIQLSSQGTSFEMFLKETGQWITVKTRLLGRHNVANILAACLLARECGVPVKEIIFSVASAEPFAHRLQLVQSDNQVMYIDDSYNSNPVGARMALEVLGLHMGGRKILVTPGYAELGPIQAAEHAKLGRLAGDTCDYLILVGSPTRTAEIEAGARQSKIQPENILCYNSLSQVKEFFLTFLKPGDMVLFENDLPDNYL